MFIYVVWDVLSSSSFDNFIIAHYQEMDRNFLEKLKCSPTNIFHNSNFKEKNKKQNITS